MIKMCIPISNHTHKTINIKTSFYLYWILTKLTHINNKNSTSITQLPGTYIFMPCLREIKWDWESWEWEHEIESDFAFFLMYHISFEESLVLLWNEEHYENFLSLMF